jgi:hypothetical protein
VWPGFDGQRNMAGTSLQASAENEIAERLGGRDLPWVPDAARAIANAMQRSRLSVLFQVIGLVHEFDAEGESYECTLSLQSFLEDTDVDSNDDYPQALRDPTALNALELELP